MTLPITIEELAIPETLDGPGADEFRTIVTLRNIVSSEVLGAASDDNTPGEVLAWAQDQHDEHKTFLVGRKDGGIVASAMLAWSTEPDTRVTWVDVQVRPDQRQQGIGTALFDHLEGIARASGRPIVQGGGLHLPVDGPRLESPTGFGSLPAEEPTVRFLLNRGYTLEQVYRYSVLNLPVDQATLDAHLAATDARVGPDYRVHTWVSPTPERWLDDLALIFRRMSTDAPAGNLEIEEEPWDAERVRRNDERRLKTGRTGLVAAVEHVPSGMLVAFNGLSVAGDRTRPVSQGVTLVLKEHRGHRLGMVTKIANIQQLQAFSPESPFIMTDNAEENRPMLDVNEAVGFVPVAYEGAWKKTVAP
jgi:GNAT superfamily N-acetyltransferase